MVRSEERRQHLDRDIAAEPTVAGAAHLAHAAAADSLINDVRDEAHACPQRAGRDDVGVRPLRPTILSRAPSAQVSSQSARPVHEEHERLLRRRLANRHLDQELLAVRAHVEFLRVRRKVEQDLRYA